MLDIDEEKERIKRWEKDQKYFEDSIAELGWKIKNTRNKLEKEKLERALKNEKEYLELIEKWIRESQEKIEKLESREK